MDGDTRYDPVAYWRSRYAAGGNSGAGAAGRTGAFKAAFVNQFARANAVSSVIDFGCGDGRQALMFDVADYCGVDISNVALQHCRALMSGDPRRRFLSLDALPHSATAQLTLSMDVIVYLTETPLYEAHLTRLFSCAERFVLIHVGAVPAEAHSHLRHRPVADDVRRLSPDWRLIAQVPNPGHEDGAQPGETGLAGFLVYAFGRPPTIIPVPEAEPQPR